MKTYAGIDLHSSNNSIGIINEQDQRIFGKRIPLEFLSRQSRGVPASNPAFDIFPGKPCNRLVS
jgi:hypothetical protein